MHIFIRSRKCAINEHLHGMGREVCAAVVLIRFIEFELIITSKGNETTSLKNKFS